MKRVNDANGEAKPVGNEGSRGGKMEVLSDSKTQKEDPEDSSQYSLIENRNEVAKDESKPGPSISSKANNVNSRKKSKGSDKSNFVENDKKFYGSTKKIKTTRRSSWNELTDYLRINITNRMKGISSLYKINGEAFDSYDSQTWLKLSSQVLLTYGLEMINCVGEVIAHYCQDKSKGFQFHLLPDFKTVNFQSVQPKNVIWTLTILGADGSRPLVQLLLEKLMTSKEVGTPIVIPCNSFDDEALDTIVSVILANSPKANEVNEDSAFNLFIQIAFALVLADPSSTTVIVDTDLELFSLTRLIEISKSLGHRNIFMTKESGTASKKLINDYIEKYNLLRPRRVSPQEIKQLREAEEKYMRKLKSVLKLKPQVTNPFQL